MTKTQTIEWAPFSQKHIDYIKNAFNNILNVAEGSIRSGKTIDHCIIASMYLEVCPDKIHLASGSTIANAKLNIGACNGFGLENLFRGRCHWGKYKDNEALFINTQTGEKIVIFAGGGKADSYKKILGNSYGLWIATEINEHYDSDDSRISFIKVAFGRQIAAKKPFTLWDLNPCSPNHKIYTDYIDNYSKNGLVGGYQYQHFTLMDNLSITPQGLEQIKSKYDVNSVWYARDILGQRVVAEGRIYTSFNKDNILSTQNWYSSDECLETKLRRNIIIAIAGVDFGGNKSSHKFTLTGITRNFREVITIKDKKIKATGVNPEQLNNLFLNFIIECKREFPNLIECRCDSAEQTLINGFRTTLRKHSIGVAIKDAIKGPINDRIRFYDSLQSQNRYYVLDICTELINAYNTAIWDSEELEDIRKDDGTIDIDSLDSQEYTTEPYQNIILKLG